MSRGFSLLEVLVTLLVIMLLFTAAARISILATRSGSYAQAHTCAAVLGHTALVRLAVLDYDSPDLRAGWHRDPANPIEYGGRGGYYRFWQIDESPKGKQVVLSPLSNRQLYLAGQATIPSDTVCFPAKLMHGHIQHLL